MDRINRTFLDLQQEKTYGSAVEYIKAISRTANQSMHIDRALDIVGLSPAIIYFLHGARCLSRSQSGLTQ